MRWAPVFALGATLSLGFPGSARADAHAALAAATEARSARHDPEADAALLAELASGPRDTADARDVAARASFLLAELEEGRRRYAEALRRYRDVLSIDAGNWYAGNARARLEVLESYGGAWDALSRLDAVRHDARAADDPAVVASLERDAGAFPPGRARAEALLFVTEAYLGRLHRPADAVAPALEVARDPRNEAVLRGTAFELAYAGLAASGQLERARREIGSDPAAPPSLRARVAREGRRRALHLASFGAIAFGGALFALSIVRLVVRGRRDRALDLALDRRALVFVLLVTFGGLAIAEAWTAGAGAHFVPFGVALLAAHLFAAAFRGAFGDAGRALRLLGGATAAACVLAAAYLVLERGEAHGTPLLSGFGL